MHRYLLSQCSSGDVKTSNIVIGGDAKIPNTLISGDVLTTIVVISGDAKTPIIVIGENVKTPTTYYILVEMSKLSKSYSKPNEFFFFHLL
jgi:hypothetical protein